MDRLAVAVTVRVQSLSSSADFAGRPRVDDRTGTQWIKAAIAYCNYRAGDGWRDLTDQTQRNDEKRWYYIEGARALTSLLLDPVTPKRPVPALAPLGETLASPSPFQLELARRFNRAELVARLMAADPSLTDRRLLSHFTKLKLAGMVIQAEQSAFALERRTA